jgi:hypothetical protein
VGKTKRGKGTKRMAVADGAGLPLAVHTAAAMPHEVTLVPGTLAATFTAELPKRLIGAKEHLQTFQMAYNFAKRLKTLKGLTPYEYICHCWQKAPERFTVNPYHHTLGLNIYSPVLSMATCVIPASPSQSDNASRFPVSVPKVLSSISPSACWPIGSG